jgi:hypothetical protein
MTVTTLALGGCGLRCARPPPAVSTGATTAWRAHGFKALQREELSTAGIQVIAGRHRTRSPPWFWA